METPDKPIDVVKKNKGGRPKLTPLEKVTREMVLKRAWNVMNTFLVDESTPVKDKAKLAVLLAGRNVPQEVDHSGEINIPIKINVVKDSDGKV